MANVLWVDDEIEVLRPHIMFLEQKGHDVTSINNGNDALEILENSYFDIIFLDQNMPGLSGLETLEGIVQLDKHIPVVMITKIDEELMMEEALGSRIVDYLIKPVNPNQMLLCMKRVLDSKRIITEKVNRAYQNKFHEINSAISDDMNFHDWAELYSHLVYWEMEMAENKEEASMKDILNTQKLEANNSFTRFVHENYADWLATDSAAPVMSHTVMRKYVLPHLDVHRPIFFIVIDNLRYDQWRAISPIISEDFLINQESLYYSILPTTTAYARNSLFAGITPNYIAQHLPQYWSDEGEEEGKNNFEHHLLRAHLKRLSLDKIKTSYYKVLKSQFGSKIISQVPNMLHNDLNVIVYNFVDMLSHARTDSNIIKELARDEAAYRSLAISWLEHSPLNELLQRLKYEKVNVCITTDHGTVQVTKPVKISGDKDMSNNLRYKKGKHLDYDSKDIYLHRDPEKIGLPKTTLNDMYAFAQGQDYFVYRNNYNHYVSYYKDTFQHGGISLEEMIIPFVRLTPR